MKKIAALFVAAVALICFDVSPADACSCISQGPACQAFWKTDAVFDAVVDSVEPIQDGREPPGGFPSGLSPTRVTMTVRHAWKGVQPGVVELIESHRGGGCGYNFKAGTRYLVFATKRPVDGRLTASICSLTQEYTAAGDSLDFLASLSQPPRGGRIFGTVEANERGFNPVEGPRTQKIATRVRLLGGGTDRTTVSTDGRFEFANLPEGHYRVEVQLPEGYTTYQPARDVHIPNGYACASEKYSLASAGKITGRVVGPDGKPARKVRIEITDWEARPHPDYGFQVVSAETDFDGFFQIEHVPAGSYVLGINLRDLPNNYNPYARTVYPETSAPHALTLAHGQNVDIGTWRVPAPLSAVKLTGVATWQDGTPAAGIHINAWDDAGDAGGRARGAGGIRTQPDGSFVLTLRERRLYEITAHDGNQRLPVAPLHIDTSAPVRPLRIVIQQNPR